MGSEKKYYHSFQLTFHSISDLIQKAEKLKLAHIEQQNYFRKLCADNGIGFMPINEYTTPFPGRGFAPSGIERPDSSGSIIGVIRIFFPFTCIITSLIFHSIV